jgi:hypothetical protein
LHGGILGEHTFADKRVARPREGAIPESR